MRAEREDEGLAQGTPRDMRGHYPAGLAESVRAVRAYRAEHPESADVLDRLNRAVYGYRRNNGWNVPLLSREGERLQGVRTALPDDGASEAVVGGGRGLPRALPAEDKGLAQDVRQGLTQGGRGLTPDAGADANAAALQGLPESAAVASGNAPTHRQNLQVRARAEGAAPGLSASENLAETDGGKRAPVAGKRPDTVLPVLNPEKAAGNIRRGRAAMNRALLEKADVRRAMYRNDIGWIDFVWGSTGRVLPNGKTKGAMGLAHVIESRMRKDGMSRDEVVGMLTNDIVEAIARGKVYKHVVNGNSERLQLRHNGYEANLIKNAGNNAWLITGYELYQNGADGVGFDTSAATHTTPTPARRDVGASDTPNVRAKDESVNTADGTRFGRAAGKVSPKKRMADAAADFTRRLAADRRKLEKAGVPLGDGEYRFEHTNRRHIDALAGVLDRLGKGGMLEEFADMAGSSHSDGLVFDGRRYLKGKEAETLQAGGLLEAVPSKSGWDYRLTQEGRALAKVMARSRDAAADGKPAGKVQSARSKDAPVAGKAAVAKNAANEKPSEKMGKAKPETFVKTALDDAEEAERKARVLQGEPVYTVDRLYEYTDFKSLKEWAVGIFNKAGNKAVNDEIGTVDLTAKSVKDSMAHGMNPAKAAAFEAVPYVVGKGVVVASTKHGEMTSYFISAPVRIAGNDDVVTVLVHHDVNKKRMYLHSVTTKENLLNTQDSTADTQVSQPRGKLYSGDIASVLKKLLEYKTETGKGVSVGKKQQKRQAESEAGSVPSEAQPKSGKDYFGLSLYESGQDYKGISEAHYRKFVAELSKLDGWRVNNRKYGRLEFRVDGEEVVFLRRLESLYSEHAVIGFSVYNSRLVEKKFDEIEFVFNPSEPPKETAERLNRFIRSIYPVSEASVQVESNPESEADTHRTPESVRAFSVTLPKLQQKRAVEHLTADALLDGGAKYPQLNGRTTKAGQVEKTLSAGFVPYEEIREQTARMGKERDKMFFKLHREAYGEDSSFDYDNSDDAELKAQTDEALREKYPPKTVYLMKHKQSGDALPITKTQFDYAVYLENMPSEGARFSLDESPDSAFARAVDDVTGGKVPAGFISLGTTPDVWKLVGLPDGKVRISGGVIDKAMNGKHSVTAEALKDLPRHLNSPIAVFKSSASSSNPDGYVVLTELVEREKGKDKPIIAALNLGRAKNGLELLDISSVYGRNNGQLTRAFNQDLLYLHKAKGRHFLTTRPLQLHWDITSDADLVKRNIKTDSDLAQYSSAKKQVSVDKAQRMAQQHAESIKKRLAESIGGLAEQVDVAAVSETAPDKAQMLLSERVEGWFDGRTGKITLVAENLTPERAVWVAWHELGHRGFAADGFAKYRAELERADGNSLIRRIADAVQEEREGTGDAAASVRSVAVEEAVVELYAAQRTGDWSGIENRYGVKVGNGLKRGIAGVLARIGAVLRRVLQRLAGKADGAMSDADVFAMLADLHGNAEGARDAVSDGVLFSIYSDDADKVARAAEPVRFADSFDSVRKQLGEVAGRLLTNRITGMTATISRKTINKMLSGKAHNKSVSLRAHLMAAVNADRLFENAIEGWVEADKGGSADVVGVHKMFAPLKVDDEILLVKLTVKELREAQGNRVYSVEAIDVSEHGNSHIPEMTEAGIVSDTASHRLNVAGLDSLIRRIKDFNRKNASGGIADFDTEAVRFSRAANIGAAISHITGKKSDLRNALKDRWDASKGIQLQFLGRRQIEDIYGSDLDGLKEYGSLSELFGADANKAVTEADKVVREWGRLKKEDAKALADLMHDATLAKVDADPLMRGDARKRLDGIRTALDIADGKIVKAKAVIASADARIARADAAVRKAQRAAELPSRYSRIGRKSCRLYGRADTK